MRCLSMLVLVSALAGACNDAPAVDIVRYSCTENAQCGAWFECRDFTCVPSRGFADVTNDVSEIGDVSGCGTDDVPCDEGICQGGICQPSESDTDTQAADSELQECAPANESCNGRDDDCDGDTDEDFVWIYGGVTSRIGQACDGPDDDSCAQGVVVCRFGTEATCEEGASAGIESCDGLDNNCDGRSDEGFADFDNDGRADCVDPDDDGDGIFDSADDCPRGVVGQFSSDDTDLDGDGCMDGEDPDDDGDGILDVKDACDVDSPPLSGGQTTGWVSTTGAWPGNDLDADGCRDIDQDKDDDADGLADVEDACDADSTSQTGPRPDVGWISTPSGSQGGLGTDHDRDGCRDSTEDLDDDADERADADDACDPDSNQASAQAWPSDEPSADHDGDGCQDASEDFDDDADGVPDIDDTCPCGALGGAAAFVDVDADGCEDGSEDLDGGRDACRGCGPGLGTCEFVSATACGGLGGWRCTGCVAGFVQDVEGRCVESMTLVAGGTFLMGASANEPGSLSDERPQHTVRLRRAFYLKDTEVTRGDWSAVSGGPVPRGDGCGDLKCPVRNIDIFNVALFLNAKSLAADLSPCYALTCNNLSWQVGTASGCSDIALNRECDGYRLPTEAEWEFAARGGTTTSTYAGDTNGNTGCSAVPALGSIGVYCANSTGAPQSVKSKNPNSLDLYDMLGNVSEWVWSVGGPYPMSSVEDPVDLKSQASMVVRGGGYTSYWNRLRSASRVIMSASTIDPSLGFRYARSAPLVNVPLGRFTMGSLDDPGRGVDEVPHDVTISSEFLMSRAEVTQSQWRALSGGVNPASFRGCDDCPVEQVDWYSALGYLNALSVAEGLAPCYDIQGCDSPDGWRDGVHSGCFKAIWNAGCTGYRLPTEAEWEYAARAKTTTATYVGTFAQGRCDVLGLMEIAWFCGNRYLGSEGADGPRDVRTRKPNDFDLYDMLGNVYEWTWDWYGEYVSGVSDPTGPPTGVSRVARGGGWTDHSSVVRAAFRFSLSPTVRLNNVGFRAARDIP